MGTIIVPICVDENWPFFFLTKRQKWVENAPHEKWKSQKRTEAHS